MKIRFSKRAEKDLDVLNEPMKTRVLLAIAKLPEGDTKNIKGYPALRRLRIGGYRVIFEIDSPELIVIISVGPRGQIYKGL